LIWPNRIRTLLAALVVGLAVLPAAPASADRAYSLRYGQVERGDIAMAANTIVTCPEGAPNCANARNATGTVLRNSAWVMVPIDIDSDPSTFDSSSADLKLPAGATVLYAGLYWGSDTKAMPEGVDAPNPAARGTMRLAAPDGSGYRTITASTVDSDRYFPHRYQGFADVTALVREAGAGTYTAANVQASTGKDQYGGWGLVVAYRDPSKPVRWLGLYDGFRDFGGDDAADVPITGFRTPPSGTVRADFGMLAYEGDLGVQPDTARINNRDLVDPLHAPNNYWNATITDHGSHVTTRNPNYVNTLGMDANVMGIDGFLGNDATSAMLHMEVATDLVMPGAMTLVSDQAASAPANTAPPAVSGVARDGQTLTAGNGTWSGTTPMTFSHRWRRCDSAGAACVDIDGATGPSYVAGAADVGRTIRVQVTARNVVSSAIASSAQTALVAARPPTSTAAPVVSGTARDGQSLSATDGSWTGSDPIAFARQWQRCDSGGGACADIAGAAGPSYTLVAADVGSTLRVRVTGTNAGGSSSVLSGPSAVVSAAPPVNGGAPSLSGTARDGQSLTAGTGSWSGTPTIGFARQWQRCDASGEACADIAFATGAAYVLTPDDVGGTVRVRVTGTNAGGSSASVSAPSAIVAAAPPVNTAAPSVSGTARDGQSLTSSPGSWSGTPTVAFARQWRRCDSSGNGCADIAGATGASYTLVAADVGSTLRVSVTGSNAGGSSPALSAPTAVVSAAPPVNSAAPSVSGTARDGQSLTATNGGWTGTPTIDFARRWRRCDSAGNACVDIAGATGASYALVPADVGRTIRVEVTGTNAGGSATAASAPSAVVAAAPPVNTAAPSVSGTARDGQTLGSTAGSWSGTPAIALARQWQRCDAAGEACLDVAGAIGTTYVLSSADVGSTIRLRVTGTNTGGSAGAVSAPTAAVAARAPASTAAPVVSGTARDGQSLTTTTGSWTGTPTIAFAYRWLRCDSAGNACADIEGATGSAYELAPADVGRTVRVRVTATNAAGSSAEASAPTAVVTARPPVSSAAPVVSGTARDGQSLTSTTGSWTGTPTIAFAHQWRRCDAAGNACTNISGATGSAYELTPGDVGHAIRVVVTATNAGGSAAATSERTALVVAGAPINEGLPGISGTARDGATLGASDGAWSGTPTITYTRRWRRCDAGGNDCSNIVGATGATYALTAGDVGSTIRLLVTAANGGGERSAESAPTAVVQAIEPSNATRPALAGTAREGEELALDDGTWTGSAPLAHSYAWERCGADGSGCLPIPGATAPRYTLVLADVGARVRGVVTAANAAGSRSAASEATAVVSAKPPPQPEPGGEPGTGGEPGPGGEPVTGEPGGSTPGGSTPEPGGSGSTPGGSAPGASAPGGSTPGGSMPGSTPSTGDDPADPRATLAATQWKSSTGTGLRLRVDSDDPIRTLAFTIPRAMLPQRGDAGRVAGRIAVYRPGAKPRTWTLTVTRAGGLAAREATGPRLALATGSLRVSALPANTASVKLTLYTRDATSPRALVKPGRTATLAASLRTTGGRLEHLTHRLAPKD
jgi:hypothetical protein